MPSIDLTIRGGEERRLLRELRAAIDQTTTEDLASWGARSASTLVVVTVRRGKNMGSLLSSAWTFLSNETRGLVASIRDGNAISHASSRADAAQESARGLGRDFLTAYQYLLSCFRTQPKETALKVSAGLLGFLVGSGGVDGDGGIPDLDFLGGIGDHRSLLTHSIVAGIVIETLVLVTLDLTKTVYASLPEEHDPFWDKVVEVSDDVFSALTVGVSTGLAYHLGMDAVGDSGGTYKNLPMSLPIEGHQAIALTNATIEANDAARRASAHTTFEIEERIFTTFKEAAEVAKTDTHWTIVRHEGGGFRLFRKAPRQ